MSCNRTSNGVNIMDSESIGSICRSGMSGKVEGRSIK